MKEQIIYFNPSFDKKKYGDPSFISEEEIKSLIRCGNDDIYIFDKLQHLLDALNEDDFKFEKGGYLRILPVRDFVEIYKENKPVTKEELDYISSKYNIIKRYDDTANNLIAFALDTDDEWSVDDLIFELNCMQEKVDGGWDWYLGDEYEEYVYVN